MTIHDFHFRSFVTKQDICNLVKKAKILLQQIPAQSTGFNGFSELLNLSLKSWPIHQFCIHNHYKVINGQEARVCRHSTWPDRKNPTIIRCEICHFFLISESHPRTQTSLMNFSKVGTKLDGFRISIKSLMLSANYFCGQFISQ